jgi:hypothetical protein
MELMRLDGVRRQRAADIALLLCVIGLTMATWAATSDANGVFTNGVFGWRACFGVVVTLFLTLAALTPHDTRARALRLAMSGWFVMAPWLLALADIPGARWAYLAAGSLTAILSTPHFLHRTADAGKPAQARR